MRATSHRSRTPIVRILVAAAWLAACGGDSTAPTPVASVEVTPATATRLVGETVQLSATTKDASGGVLAGRAVTWTTSSADIATVNSTGRVTGVAEGIATITATSEGKSGTATITIQDLCSASLAQAIAVGQTKNGALGPGDCQLSDQSYADVYVFTINLPTNVQIDLVSTAFDAFLFLFAEVADTLEYVDDDDDDGGGSNARIVAPLAPGTYYVVANSFDGGETGAYDLSVSEAAIMGGAVGGARLSTRGKRVAPKITPSALATRLLR